MTLSISLNIEENPISLTVESGDVVDLQVETSPIEVTVVDGFGIGNVTSINNKSGAVVLETDDIFVSPDYNYVTDAELSDIALIGGISSDLSSHVSDLLNPHEVTKSQIGLSDVDNTSDLNKPISTQTQNALDGKVNKNLPILPETKTKIEYNSEGIVIAGYDATTSDISEVTDKRYVTDSQILKIGEVDSLSGSLSSHIADLSNPHEVTKNQVGLSEVDNTSDVNKPISTATQTALNGKQNLIGYTPEDVANKSDSGLLGISTTLFPTQRAVKEYVDTSFGNVSVSWGDIDGMLSNQTDLNSALSSKVDVVSGKQLSTNDFTNADRTKLDGIQSGAEVNVNADWNSVSGDSFILNKPSIPNELSDLLDDPTHRTVTDTEKSTWNSKQDALGFTPENTANKNQVNGYAGLDSIGKISPAQIPAIAITDTFVVNSESSMLSLSAERGDVCVRTDLNKSYILTDESPEVLASWQELLSPTDQVQSVFGRTGVVTAQSNDYTWNQINKLTSDISDITNRSHTDLTDIGVNSHVQIDSHISSISNPHQTSDANLQFSDITDNDATTLRHGFLPKLSGNSNQYLNGAGVYSSVSGSSTPSGYSEVSFTGQTSVSVFHNFGVKPLVSVLNSLGGVISPLSITHNSDNDFTVTFSGSSSGTIISTAGSQFPNIVSVSEDYLVLNNDNIVVVTASGVIITLPTAVGKTGKTYVVDNSSSGEITIKCSGTETLQGEIEQTLSSGNSLDIYSTNVSWRVK